MTNTKESQSTSKLSRRALIASMGLTGAGMLVGRLSPGTQLAYANPLPLEWNVVTDFGATGDGSTDDTVAIQSALNTTISGGTVYFPQGTYVISSQLTVVGKEIHIFATGAAIVKEASVLGVPILKLSQAHGSTITGLHCQGAETYNSFAGASNLFNAFIQLDRCNQAVISGCKVLDKTYPFLLSSCQDCRVADCFIQGFLNIGKAGANYCSCCHISGGARNSVIGLSGKDMGSGVLIGLEGTDHHITDCFFQNMWDNGVYVSSGKGILIDHVTVIQTAGGGIKVRGQKHIVSNCAVKDCVVGYTLTGNGATPDSLGYNGHGTLLEGCVAENCLRDGILMNTQDGYNARGFKILNNTIINSAIEGGGYAGIRMTTGPGTEVSGNSFSKCSGSYGILITGPLSTPVSGLKINNNSVALTKEGIRLQYATHSTVIGNHVQDIETYGMHLRYCTDCVINSNIGQEQVLSGLIRCLTSDGCSSNTIIGNRGNAMNVSKDSNLLFANQPGDVNFTNNISSTPFYVGQQALVSGESYMAVGVSSPADWKKLS
jgi:parallel beta-helix repeat protein